MELYSDKPWVVGKLHDLDKFFIGRNACDPHTGIGKDCAVSVIEFPAVTVTLVNEFLTVDTTTF